MNRFVSEDALKTEAARVASMTKADREWEEVRGSGGIGSSGASSGLGGASGPSLFEQLRAQEERDALESEETRKEKTGSLVLGEDEIRFFDEQKRRDRDDARRMEREVDSFKKAAARATAAQRTELALLTQVKAKSDTPPAPKKMSLMASLTAQKPPSSPLQLLAPSSTESKKRPNADVTSGAPATKKPSTELTNASAAPTEATNTKIPLVKYNRNDDDE